MSQPEWMKKFNEIGQKGDEEVTTKGEGSEIMTSPTPNRRESLKLDESEVPPAAPLESAGTAEKPKGGGFLFKAADKKDEPKAESGDDDEAAKMFASAGGGGASGDDEDPAAMFANAGGGDDASTDDDDPAAMFANAGGGDAASTDDEDPAAMFAKAAEGDAASTDDDSVQEEVIEEEVVEDVAPAGGEPDDKKAISDWRRQRGEEEGEAGTEAPAATEAAEAEAAPITEEAPVEEEAPREFPESPPVDEEDNWVPNKEGENDVVVDEDGNEIIEDDDEVIEVDDDGNEIIEDDDEVIEDEDVFMDEDGNEIVEDVVPDEVSDGEDETRELPLGDEDKKVDLQAQRDLLYKTPKYERSVMSAIVPLLIFAVLLAAGLLVAYLVFDVGEDDAAALGPTQAPAVVVVPLAPTNIGVIDVAETTPLDPVTGNCDFGDLTQPHVIDQCACGPTINTIATDVMTRYETLVPWVSSLFSDWDETATSCSTRNQALVWMSTGLSLGGEISDERRRDRYVSAYLYIDQGGEGWANSNSWLSDADVCKWIFVFCDQEGSLVGLDLEENNLEGQLSDAITMYEFVEFISVRRNQLGGTLPEGLFTSRTLKSIDLYENNIFGDIPSFDPNIPLETLHMGSNSLSGRIYPSIANAKSLARLDLSSNTLNGALPSELFDLPLEELSLHTNLFSGEIPSDIGKTTSLVKLDIGNNGFSGELPVEMGALTNMEELLIRNLPQLTGRVPASFGLSFRNLVRIVISQTSINGNIPETFGSISNLETIDFSRNFFRGGMPSELGNLINLKTLDLFDNDISGTIPAEFGNMTALEELLLEDNNISGDIPSQLGKLENLQSLALQENNMGGRAPDEVCELRNEELNVFIVDCPERGGGDDVSGIICRIPSCCTDCK